MSNKTGDTATPTSNTFNSGVSATTGIITPGLQKDSADRITREAHELHQRGRKDDAALLYERALELKPNDFDNLHCLGLIRAEQGKFDEAIGLLRRAVDQSPNSAEANINLAVVCELLDYPEETIAHCTKAIEIMPNSAAAHFTAGNAYQALGCLQEAIAHFERAILAKPSYAEAYFNIGNIFAGRKYYEDALAPYNRALAIKPQYPKAMNNRGVALQTLGRCDDALKDFDTAIAIKSNYLEAVVNRGNALLQLGRQEEAMASFDYALLLEPDQSSAEQGAANRRSSAWLYGEALANYGKATVFKSRDLAMSTKSLEEGLRRLAAAGALALPETVVPTYGYPLAMYPEALRAVMRCLDAAGIEPFLTGGTLLGAIRHGDFISFDKDLDFGISAAVTPADLRRAMATDPDFELSWDPGEDGPLIAYFWKEKVAIDFFRFFRGIDHMWCGISISGHPMKWVHRPFDLVDFRWHDVGVKIPHDSDRFLTETYGDWRTPNPYFGLFASPNIEGGFPPISRNIAYSSIFVALWRRERKKAVNLCNQAHELDPTDPLVAELCAGLAASSGNKAKPSPTRSNAQPIPESLGQVFEDLPG
jgi:tetratricopeptide (TPR) repeat protein